MSSDLLSAGKQFIDTQPKRNKKRLSRWEMRWLSAFGQLPSGYPGLLSEAACLSTSVFVPDIHHREHNGNVVPITRHHKQ